MNNHTITESTRDDEGRRRFDAERYAFVIAQGQINLLSDVPSDQSEEVVGLVREHSRKNLVHHIARCIVADLSTEQAKE